MELTCTAQGFAIPVEAVFGTGFKTELPQGEAKYAEVSAKL
jgi:hypothetical protein